MPGTKEKSLRSSWFKDTFGFDEEQMNWQRGEEKFQDAWGSDRKKLLVEATRSRFFMDGETLVCKTGAESEGGERRFHVGPFGIEELQSLKSQLEEASKAAPDEFWNAGSLTFRNVVAKTAELHADPQNAGAVFQAASLFNCLETSPPGTEPEEGVTIWAAEHTQGPTCAVACPAATVYRTYFAGGEGQSCDNQVDCLSSVAELVDNEAEGYWRMRSGYCMPGTGSSISRLSAKIAADPGMAENVRSRLKVGVHWDTEVAAGTHRVCQVFCSALPVGIVKSVRASDWAAFAAEVLTAGFDATLTVAAILARRRGERVKVYLTLVGGGALGNRRQWIATAIDKALGIHRAEPLDVELVHYMQNPPDGPCAKLETGRSSENLAETGAHRPLAVENLSRPTSVQKQRVETDLEAIGEELQKKESINVSKIHRAFSRFDADGDGQIDRGEFAEIFSWYKSSADQVALAFGAFDSNGDGAIDRREFTDLLRLVNPEFFTQATIDILLEEADADGDGVIHYAEFLAWLYEEDPIVVSRVLSTASLYEEH